MMRKREVDDKVVVTDEAVRQHYTENKTKFLKPAEYRASQIMIKVDPSSNKEEKTALREKAEKILKKVQNGADFAQLAEQESDDMSRIKGGDLGFFHAGVTEAEFDEAIKQMKVGEIRGLVETIYGFHIIKLTDKKEPHQLEFDEIKAKIKNQLVDAEKKRLSTQWMDQLKGKATIVYSGKVAP
jgi:parvulin-like peptidyl-prolyl isomerase